MSKQKTIYFCTNCGYESPKWVGKCPACNSWNSMVEEKFSRGSSKSVSFSHSRNAPSLPVPLAEVGPEQTVRVSSRNNELNRVLGGGIVPGSVVLIAGEPGIGKSTLMLQVALGFEQTVLYVSGEESTSQIRMRADRMSDNLSSGCLLYTETLLENIVDQIRETDPSIVILDSIQTLYSEMLESSAGSVSQVRHCAAELIAVAKSRQVPIFMVGHITKEGSIAGPKVLEHMVDTVLQFEGDRHLSYRMLRTTKNRFGSTSELGIYEMLQDGLREVENPSEILLTQRDMESSGVAIGATQEGNRILLIEIQSLVGPAAYGTPQRTATGFDSRRLNMLLAVLEKRSGFRFGNQDVFLNIAGGLRVEDPALDLAVCSTLVSSLEEVTISEKFCFAAEVGLGGELRAVNKLENRISEAEKLGFEAIYCSKHGMKGIDPKKYQLDVRPFGRIGEVFSDLFG